MTRSIPLLPGVKTSFALVAGVGLFRKAFFLPVTRELLPGFFGLSKEQNVEN